MPAVVAPLLPFPSKHARDGLSPSQLSTLYAKISCALGDTLNLPPDKRDNPQTISFLATYARDVAQECLQNLIWGSKPVPDNAERREARSMRAQVLKLAEQVAPSGLLPLTTLLDLCVAYVQHPTRLKNVIATAFSANASLFVDVDNEVVPAFKTLLASDPSGGLYGLRKVAHTLICFVRMVPAEAKLSFARNPSFMVSMATAYNSGLWNIARSYGGLRVDSNRSGADLDEWERLILEIKVALLDALHVLLSALFDSLAHASGSLRGTEAARALDMLFSLQDLQTSLSDDSAPSSAESMAFLNRSILVDYQHAYKLDRLLEQTIAKAEADDARAAVLAASLRSLDDCPSGPAALTLLLGSGRPIGRVQRTTDPSSSGPSYSSQPPVATQNAADEAMEAQIGEVLSILPDQDRSYVRALLKLPEYAGVERVIEALLEGTAPPMDSLTSDAPHEQRQQGEEWEFTRDRHNIFDEEEMDLSRVQLGKKRETDVVLGDRAYISQIKSDILRAAEAGSDDELEQDDHDLDALAEIFGPSYFKSKNTTTSTRKLALDDGLEALDSVNVAGDGEESDESDEIETERGQIDIHTILELAYISNPKVFDRDSNTRRGKERAALREQTGWADEQIEGWRVMLERNPKMKERIEQKHDFKGNRPSLPPSTPSSAEPSRSATPSHRGGRGRGRGRGRGGASARGGGSQGGGGGNGDRAWKDKNKATRANHNRKRGHDQKMQKAGGAS